MLVKIEELEVKDRGRRVYEKIPELAKSLQDNGQLQNIVIRKPVPEDNTKKPWVLVAGGRRVAAAIHAGFDELRAESIEDLPRWRQKVLELEENIQRQNMTWQEELEMKLKIQELHEQEDPSWRQADTAQVLHETSANVSRDLDLAREIRKNPELKQAATKRAAARQVKMTREYNNRKAQLSVINVKGLEDRLVHGDAVDLLLTDLPWGIDFYEGSIGSDPGQSEYDDSEQTTEQLIDKLVPEIVRVVKPSGWICIVMNWQFHQYLREKFDSFCQVHAQPIIQCAGSGQRGCKPLQCEPLSWIWYRPNSRRTPLHPELHAKNVYELILVCNRGEAKFHTPDIIDNVLVYETDYTNRIHAMQKPEGLADELIRRLSIPGQIVVDCCMGSGVFMRSAAKLMRQFRGCELNETTRNLAVKYVSETYQGEEAMRAAIMQDKIGPETEDDDDFEDSELDPDELDDDEDDEDDDNDLPPYIPDEDE